MPPDWSSVVLHNTQSIPIPVNTYGQSERYCRHNTALPRSCLHCKTERTLSSLAGEDVEALGERTCPVSYHTLITLHITFILYPYALLESH